MHSDEVNIAVAVSYSEEDHAPTITAKGVGDVAERIVRLAEENEVTISKSPEIAVAMSKIPLGEEIPEEMFDIMAIVLSEIYATKPK